MKIGIVTFHNGSNYGAALQTYALQEKYRELGHEVSIINYQNEFIMAGLNPIRRGRGLKGLYFTLYDLLNYNNNKRKISGFIDFFNSYYSLTEPLDKEALKNKDLGFDVVVSGSDQIWNPLLNGGFDDIYFGQICNSKLKISYASSCGAYNFDDSGKNEEIKHLLEDYKSICVRENSEILSRIIGREVGEVCDPTLLLSHEDWCQKAQMRNEHAEGKYILVYALCDFDNVLRFAKEVARTERMPIKFIGKLLHRDPNIEYICDAGPIDFLKLFNNASIIITNSFHGTAFSVNFNKEFYSLVHPSSPERAATFLKHVELFDRLIKPGEKYSEVKGNTIDYSIINKRLLAIIEESEKWLLPC